MSVDVRGGNPADVGGHRGDLLEFPVPGAIHRFAREGECGNSQFEEAFGIRLVETELGFSTVGQLEQLGGEQLPPREECLE